MKNIRIKDLITFKRLTERRKNTFLINLQKEKVVKEKEDSSGGDYWVRSISALNNAFRENDNRFISEKITDIINDYSPKLSKGTKDKYDRNLQILYNYEDFDFRSLTPPEEVEILSKARKSGIIEIAFLSVKVETHHIYTFIVDEKEYLGALLFAAQKDGYQPSELGVFAEAIYNFLETNYSSKYIIHPSYVRVVGVMTSIIVDYQMVLDGELPSIILPIIENVKEHTNI